MPFKTEILLYFTIILAGIDKDGNWMPVRASLYGYRGQMIWENQETALVFTGVKVFQFIPWANRDDFEVLKQAAARSISGCPSFISALSLISSLLLFYICRHNDIYHKV